MAARTCPQLFMTAGCHGRPLRASRATASANNYHANAGNGGPALVKAGSSGLPQPQERHRGRHPRPAGVGGVLHGQVPQRAATGIRARAPRPASIETCDIHCIIHDENAYLQTGPNMKRGIEAHRKMDFVLSKAQFMTTQAMYSDIVLARDDAVGGSRWPRLLRTASSFSASSR